MDFKNIDLTKIVNLEQLEKTASKAQKKSAGGDKFAMAMMILKPMMKSLPAKAKYIIALALLSLITGAITIAYFIVMLISYLVRLCIS